MEILDVIAASSVEVGDLIGISETEHHGPDYIQVEAWHDTGETVTVVGVSLYEGDKVTVTLDADENVSLMGA